MVNFAIDYASDKLIEDKLFEDTIDTFKKARDKDTKSEKLSVIAQTK